MKVSILPFNCLVAIFFGLGLIDTVYTQDCLIDRTTNTEGTWKTSRELYIEFFVASSKRVTRDGSDDVLVIDFDRQKAAWWSLVLNLTSNESDTRKDRKSSSASSSTSKVVRNLKSDFVKVGWNEIILSFPQYSKQLIVKDTSRNLIENKPWLSKPADSHVKVRGLFSSINCKSFSDEDDHKRYEVKDTNVDIPIEFNYNSALIGFENWRSKEFEGAINSDGHLERFNSSALKQNLLNCKAQNNITEYDYCSVPLPLTEEQNLENNGFVATVIQFHCLSGCPFTVKTIILKSTLKLEEFLHSTKEEKEENESEDETEEPKGNADPFKDENDNSDTVYIIVIIVLSVALIATIAGIVRFRVNTKLQSKNKKVEPNVTYEQKNNALVIDSDVTNDLSRISEPEQSPQLA